MTGQRLTYLLILISTIYFGQTWQWAKSGDGPGLHYGRAICTDKFGNVFNAGYFYGSTTVFGSYTLTNTGSSNVYLAKFDPNGNVLWAISSTGSQTDWGMAVSCDNNGNVFLTGSFMSPTFVFGSTTLTSTGGNDLFLIKFDPNGNVIWAKNPSGPNSDYGQSVSTDLNGNSYITGYTSGTLIAFGSYSLSNPGMFLAKYDPNGNVVWAKCPGGGSNSNGKSVSSDSQGNTCVTGSFGASINFDTYTLTNTGASDIFIVKYDLNGNVLWAKNPTGASSDAGSSVSLDNNGNAYVTGGFQSSVLSFDSYTVSNPGISSVFIAKYNTIGNVLWAKASYSAGNNAGFAIASDGNNIIVTGKFYTDGSIVFDTYTLISTPPATDPMFIVRLDNNGNFIFADYFKSGGPVAGQHGLCIDNLCNAYVTSDFYNYLFQPFLVGTNSLTPTGTRNIFLAKLSFSNNCIPTDISQSSNSNSNSLFSVFPNPNNGLFKIQIGIKCGQLILINSLGQKVHEQKIIQGSNEIKTNGLPIGLYNCILFQDNRQINSGRLILE